MPTGELEDDRMSVAIRSARTADLDFIVDCNARLAQETEQAAQCASVAHGRAECAGLRTQGSLLHR